MSKPKEIELHPGHWKLQNSGANGHIQEVPEARKVTRRVYEILRAAKVPATYYEDNVTNNKTDNVNHLIAHHNADRDGLIVSIHFNAGGDGRKAIGTEVLYKTQKALAARVSKAISDATGGGLIDRGAKYRDNVGVLTRTFEPAILIEVCFVNSAIDTAIYKRDFEKICQAIAKVLAAEIGYTIGQSNTAAQPATAKKEENEVAQQILNETGRKECREMIKRGVEEKLFTSDHKNVDKYDDTELLSYSMAYLNRKNK